MISCSLLLMWLWKKGTLKLIKLLNDNGRKERRLCSPTSHKLIILSAELQVCGDSCLIWFCHRGDLILAPVTAASQTAEKLNGTLVARLQMQQ